jgi:hypothetical protein
MIHACMDMVIHEFSSNPLFRLSKIKSENLFFYIEYAWLTFSFVQVRLYATMGKALFGLGFNSPIELCRQKLRTKNQ